MANDRVYSEDELFDTSPETLNEEDLFDTSGDEPTKAKQPKIQDRMVQTETPPAPKREPVSLEDFAQQGIAEHQARQAAEKKAYDETNRLDINGVKFIRDDKGLISIEGQEGKPWARSKAQYEAVKAKFPEFKPYVAYDDRPFLDRLFPGSDVGKLSPAEQADEVKARQEWADQAALTEKLKQEQERQLRKDNPNPYDGATFAGTDIPMATPGERNAAELEKKAKGPAPTQKVWRDFTERSAEAFVNGLVSMPRGVAEGADAARYFATARKDDLQNLNRDRQLDNTFERSNFAKTMQKVSEDVRKAFPGDKTRADEFISRLGQGGGSMLSFMVGGAAVRSLGIPSKLGTMATGAGVGGVGGLEDAEQHGADTAAKYLSFLLNAGIGTSEAIPIDRALHRLNMASGGKVADIISSGAVSSLEEMIQEVGQQLGGNKVAQILYDDKRDIFEGVEDSAKVAGVLGFLTGGGFTAAGHVLGGKDAAQPAPPTPELKQEFAPDEPTAEPRADIKAQIADLHAKDSPRMGVYLSKDAATHAAEEVKGAKGVPIENFDGKGGVLIARSNKIAQQAIQARDAGVPMQTILGKLTGAGEGKPADGRFVVQQVNKDGAVVRESLVNEKQLAATEKAFERGGHTVRTVSPEEAVKRREEMIVQDNGGPPPVGKAPMAPAAPKDFKGAILTDHDIFDEPAPDAPASMHVNTQPTEAQKAAGNYRKGHTKVQGLDIAIENPKGSARTGKAPDGTEWSVTMPAAYGYVKRTKGADGDPVDVFLGPKADTSDKVFVIDQVDPETGNFDEHKAVLGVDSADEAAQLYHQSFSDGRGGDRIANMVEMSVDEFKTWARSGNTKKPLWGNRMLPPAKFQNPSRPAQDEAGAASPEKSAPPAPGTAKPAPRASKAISGKPPENMQAPMPATGIKRREVADDEAITASGRRVPVKYAVVEAADLVPSQLDDGNANPAYPAELQPRDRERRMSGAQVQEIASRLEPRWLDKSPKASDGAPIVSPDGVVESGNGRTLAIRRAYDRSMPGAERYRAYLKEQGYPVDGFEKPVLVRVRQGDMTTDERVSLAEDANEDDKLDLSTPERAMIDARRLTDGVMSLYQGGDVDEAGNREFTKAFLDKVASKGSRGKMVDDAGVLNQDGMKRISAALLAKAYGDSDLVGKLMESTNVSIKGIGSALLDVAGTWAQMRAEAAEGKISREVDQTKALLEAVRIVDRARREGKPVSTFVKIDDIFSGTGVSVETEFFLRLMFRDTENWKQPVSRKSLSDALTFFVGEARKTFEGTDLLGETAPPARDILTTAKRKQTYDNEGDAADQGQLQLQKPQRPVEEDGAGDGADAGTASEERQLRAEDAGSAEDEGEGGLDGEVIGPRDLKITAPPTSPYEGLLDEALIEDLAVKPRETVTEWMKDDWANRANLEEVAEVADAYRVAREEGADDEADTLLTYMNGWLTDLRKAKPTDKFPKLLDLPAPKRESTPDQDEDAVEPLDESELFDDSEGRAAFEAVGGTMPPEKVFPAPAKTVNIDKEVESEGFLPPEAAAAKLEEWKAEATRQGATGQNAKRVIFSLFDYTGAWSQPYRDAGFTVIQYDIQFAKEREGFEVGSERYDDILQFMPVADILSVREAGYEVYGVLAATPCTTFAGSGARWWADRHDKPNREMVEKVFGPWVPEHYEVPLEVNKDLVMATIAFVEMANPTGFHVMENPIGRIAEVNDLPDPLARFHPHNFGNPYTKRTQLWGDFGTDLPTANVNPSEGSKMQSKMGSANKVERSETPEGFAYAFFMANNPESRPAEQVKGAPPFDPKAEVEVSGIVQEPARKKPSKAKQPAKAERAYGESNKLVTADRAAELRAKIKAKLSGQLNAGIDPEMLAMGAELAAFHIEAGARKFADFARAVAGDLGSTVEKLRPYLRSWYNGARDLMEDNGLDVTGMDDAETVKDELRKLFDEAKLPARPVEAPQAIEKAEATPSKMPAKSKTKAAKEKEASTGDLFGSPSPTAPAEAARNWQDEGKSAFEAGRMRMVPADIWNGADRKEGIKRADAWLRGWDRANLAAPVPGLTMPGQEAQKEPARKEGADNGSDAGQGLRTGSQDVPGATQSEVPEGSAGPGDVLQPGGQGRGADARTALRPDAGGSEQPVQGSAGRDAEEAARAGSDSGSGGRNRDDRVDPSAVERTVEAERESALPPNYRITDADHIGEGGPKAKVAANLEALRLLKQLEAENRKATPSEQAILVRYVGWGAFAQDMFQDAKPEWARERAELKALLTPEEYDSARASVLNAHYTSADVIKGMWAALTQIGFTRGGRALEPASGVGHFLGLTPEALRPNMKWTTTELDKVTGAIAKQLYQQADVNVQGFETLNRPNGFYDLAISNVPFGSFNIRDTRYKSDYLIHDYFFIRSLDLVRPGGIVAFITSSGTMDKANDSARAEIMKRGDLVGAIRLPGGRKGAFAGNAGTDVTTDIIFLRKKGDRIAPIETAWQNLKEIQTPDGPIRINEYFADHPEMMLGEMRLTGTMYRDKAPVLEGDATNIEQKIIDAARRMPENVYVEADSKPLAEPKVIEAEMAGRTKEGAFYLDGDKVMRKVLGLGTDPALSKVDQEKVRQLVSMRDTVSQLLDVKRDRSKDGVTRQRLNKLYDAFVKKYGPINRETVTITSRLNKAGENIIIRRLPNMSAFRADPDAYKVAAIENYDAEKDTATKAAIFSGDVVSDSPSAEIKNAVDGIGWSLNAFGELNLTAIGDTLGKSKKQVIEELGDRIYLNPNGERWEPAEQYLAGDVVEKLDDARAAAEADQAYERNVKALEAVQPTPLTAEEITAPFGAAWVPATVYQQFFEEVIGTTGKAKVTLNPVTKQYLLSGVNFSISAQTQFGTSKVGVAEIVSLALQMKSPRVTEMIETPDGKREVVNEEATREAQVKSQLVRKLFEGNPEEGVEGWVWQDADRSELLAKLYNRKFNRLVAQKFDGSHLTFPGLATKITDGSGNVIPFALRDHQKAAVWRAIVNGNTLLDHVVGAGKTFTMIAAAMEKKRLGQIQRPMFIVPNHMLEQFSREFLQAYPNANILVAQKDEMTRANRKAFAAKIAAERWDGIVITHDAFGRLPLSKEVYVNFMKSEIEEIEQAIRHMKASENKKDPTVKQLEQMRKRAEVRLKNLIASERKDEGVLFEELGVDQLILDEAHLFKNLAFYTQHTRVKGLAQAASQRAMDLFLKVRELEKTKPGNSSIFATGTPISNTMAEMYTMQRYLQLDELVKLGIDRFDAWASTFGEIRTNMELSPDGRTFRETSSFSRFRNLPELVALYSKMADTKTADMLNLPRPKLRGGKPIVVEAEPSAAEENYILGLVARAEQVRGKKAEKGGDNMLKVVSEGRKVALDYRLIDPDYGEMNPRGKVAKMVDNAVRIWKDGNDDPVAKAQLIFSDMGVPFTEEAKPALRPEAEVAPDEEVEANDNADDVEEVSADESEALRSRYNLYEEIRRQLVARGIPKQQIAFIHEAKDDSKKAALFEKVRRGEVRILLGSTSKMGVGTNVQKRLKAMHHLDAPWKPAEVEQRDGRILRQGNMNPEIDIYRYITKRSFDSFMWQTLERKANFIAQIKAGARGVRIAEDIDSPLPEAAELKAAASGDPRIMQHAELTKEVRDLEAQLSSHVRTIGQARRDFMMRQEELGHLEKQLPKLTADAAKVPVTGGDNFKVELLVGPKGEFTKRAEAGAAVAAFLQEQAAMLGQPVRQLKVARFNGLDIIAKLDLRHETPGVTLSVEGYSGRGVQFGLAVDRTPQLDSALMSRMESELADLQSVKSHTEYRIEQIRKELPKVEAAAADRPFPRMDRYKAAKQELADLTKALAEQKQKASGPTVMGNTAEQEQARESVKPWRTMLDKVAQGFGYKIVDTGLPFGFTDRWGKFHSFGTQIIDKAFPGSDVGKWMDSGWKAIPGLRDYIRENMTAPWAHRVWFGHDPLANISGLIDKFGISAIPDYALQLFKDSLTKAGIPLPGVQWLVHAGLVSDRAATAWLSLNIGEALSGGLSILGTYRLMKQVKNGEPVHRGWAALGILFKVVGGTLSANPVVLMSAATDTVLLARARPQTVKATLERVEKQARRIERKGGPTIYGNTDETAPTFYSGLLRSVEGLKMTKAPAAQWLATIKNQPGIKQEEMDWIGLADWLNAQPGAVTKEALADFIRANQVQVTDVVKGGQFSMVDMRERNKLLRWLDDESVLNTGQPGQYFDIERAAARGDQGSVDRLAGLGAPSELLAPYRNRVGELPGGATKFSSYQLPGWKEYRELLLTLPLRSDGKELRDRLEIAQGPDGKWNLWDGKGQGGWVWRQGFETRDEAMATALRDDMLTVPSRRSDFTSGHWDEPNVLAHVRFNERQVDGKRVLFLEEIQSDWHQKGRKQGYKTTVARLRRSEQKVALADAPREVQQQIAQQFPDRPDLPLWKPIKDVYLYDGGKRWIVEEAADDVTLAEWAAEAGALPDAPFKTTWPELALKRMIRWAAENGFDSIAWTPGDVQAERYDLSKQISRIEYEHDPEMGWNLNAFDLKGKMMPAALSVYKTEADLEAAVGKDIAQKIVNKEGKKHAKWSEGYDVRVLSGLDLKVGGEGMKAFYDKMLVDTANKLGKKFGAKVGQARFPGTASYDMLVQTGRTTGIPLSELDAMPVAERKALIDSKLPTFPSLPITPEMRRAAMQGQPLFEVGPAPGPKVKATPAQLRAATLEVRRLTGRMLGQKIKTYVADDMPAFIPNEYIAAYGNDSRTIYITMRAAQELAKNVGHETLHALRRLGLITDPEWNALVAAAKKGNYQPTASSLATYRREYVQRFGMSEDAFKDMLNEESVARMMGAFVASRENSAVARIIDKLRSWADAVLKAIGAAGVELQAREFLRDAYAGKIGRRDGAGRDGVTAGNTDEYSPSSGYNPLHKFVWRSSLTLGSDAKAYVLREGGNIRGEAILSFDSEGRVLSDGHGPAGVSRVDISPEHAAAQKRFGAGIVTHHNHPSTSSLSVADIAMQAFPGAGAVWAHTRAGSYRATLNPDLQFMGFDGLRKMLTPLNKWVNPMVQVLQDRVNERLLDPDLASMAFTHWRNEALHRAGVIHYFTDVLFGSYVELNTAVDQSAEAIREGFANEGIVLGDDRRANAVRYLGDMGVLPKAIGRPAEQGAARGADPGGGRGNRGPESGQEAGLRQEGLILGNMEDQGPRPAAMAIDGEGEAELEDLAGNINLRRLNTPDDIKAMLKQVANDAGGFIAERRGVVSNEQTAALAAELGMTVKELLQRTTGSAFNAHQIFAARVMLLKSAERVKRLAATAKTSTSVTDLAEFQKAVVRHRAIQEQVAGMTAEAGRALQQFNMIAGKDYLRGLDAILGTTKNSKATFDAKRKGETEVTRELAEMVDALSDPAQIGKFIADSRKATAWDMVREAWINGLLSGPRTHAANILSNTLTALWQVPETSVAAAIGMLHGGEKVQAGEATARLFGLVQGARDGLEAAAHLVKTGEPADAISKLESHERRAIPGKLGSVIRTPSRLLEAEDQFFKAVNYRAEINALAYRQAAYEGRKGADFNNRVKELVTNPSQKMQHQAHQAALYQTFQNKLGPKGQWVMNLREAIPGAWLVLPFIRTPANILKYAAERTPLGLAMKPVRDNLTGKNGNVARDIQAARMVVGSAVMASVVMAVAAGMVTGGAPDDPDEERILRATGWQPYSIRIGDTYVSYQRLDPIALIVGIAADSVGMWEHISNAEGDKLAATLVTAIANNIKEKTWISGLVTFNEAFFSGDAWKLNAWANRLASSVVPQAVAQWTQSQDPFVREARTMMDAIKARVPGQSSTLMAKRNVFGEQIKREGALGPDFMSPFFVSTVKDNPLANEMLRVGYYPSMPDRSLAGHKLTAEQYDRYVELSGQRATTRLNRLIASSRWNGKSDTEKQEAIRDEFVAARKIARDELRKLWPELRKKAED